MALNDDDMTTTHGAGEEGPADSGAGQPSDPNEHDGGADGGANQGKGGSEKEGPSDAGAGDSVDPKEHDGGADGSA